VSSRPRNIQQLISEWVSLTHARNSSVREHLRGYDARYAQCDIDRQRAVDEARAAAEMATQYGTDDCIAPRAG
jgi:hypothetical protein